jgi:hypothetical protein
MSGVDESAGLRDQLEEQAGAKTELEEAGVDWPLEADEPELEHDHPGAEDGLEGFESRDSEEAG